MWILALLMFAATDPITDEALRLEALRAVFPGMPVVAVPGKRVRARERDWKSVVPFPDAMAGESVYRVTGLPRNEVERCNADRGLKGPSMVREVALRLYAWPRLNTDFVAVLQYEFTDASASMPCSSIGLIVHLSRGAEKLEATEEFLVNTEHHWSLPGIQLVDLTGDGIEELVVESDIGGAYISASNLYILDLSRGRLSLRAETSSHVVRLEPSQEEEFATVLDIPRSRLFAGAKFCFVETVYKKLTSPRVKRLCIPARDNLK